MRAAQMAVYELLDIKREIPPITPHDKSLRTQFEALVKAFKWWLARDRACQVPRPGILVNEHR